MWTRGGTAPHGRTYRRGNVGERGRGARVQGLTVPQLRVSDPVPYPCRRNLIRSRVKATSRHTCSISTGPGSSHEATQAE
eukprot:918258-Pyramimonas_sp.AAC.1